MPTVDDYISALQSLPLSENDLLMLKVHYDAEHQTISPRQLSKHLGWTNPGAANLHYGRLAGRIKDALGGIPSPSGDPNDVGVLAYAFWPPDNELVWEMYPEFATALTRLYFYTPPPISENGVGEPAHASVGVGKGPVGKSLRNRYLRSEDVRRRVLKRAAGECEACLQPAPFVSAGGEPFLETHHTEALSEFGRDDPNVVGAICPNCHRRIHLGIDGKDWNRRLQERITEKELRYGTQRGDE
jgi:predicted HNH restriction endonuclease